MGTCSSKDSMTEYKFNFEIPKKESFSEMYNATKEFFLRSELITVFKAYNKKLGTAVLAKQISKSILKYSVQMEIAILQKLDHPFVIKIVNYFETEHHYFIVYQYHEGHNILDYMCNEDNGKTLSDLRTIFRKFLTALNHIHSHKVVHCKLDLSNLFYDSHNGVCISGFGFSKDLSRLPKGDKTLLTHDNFMVTSFQAPEVLERSYSYAGDVWSLGVGFYALSMAEMPFKADKKEALEKLIKNESINKAKLHKKGLPDSLIDVLSKMLDKNPALRWTPERLLKHSFFETPLDNVQKTQYLASIQEMKAFVKHDRLTQKMLLAIADLMSSSADRSALAESFNRFGKNKDGKVNLEEFLKAIEFAGLIFKGDEGKELFHKIDQNKNGTIEYTEYLAVFIDHTNESFQRKLKALFNEIDLDSDSYVSVTEIRIFLGDVPEISEEIIKFHEIAGADKLISFEEFRHFFTQSFDL